MEEQYEDDAQVAKEQRTPLTVEELKDMEAGLIAQITNCGTAARLGIELLAEVKRLREGIKELIVNVEGMPTGYRIPLRKALREMIE